MKALAAALVALWTLASGIAVSLALDTLVGDRRFWLELSFGSKRRLLEETVRFTLEAAPLLFGLGIAVFAAARLAERARRSPLLGALASLVLGGALGALLGGLGAAPALMITGLMAWVSDQAIRRVMLGSAR